MTPVQATPVSLPPTDPGFFPTPPETTLEVFRGLPQRPVMIECRNEAGTKVSHGSGFRVSDALFVTSAHVVDAPGCRVDVEGIKARPVFIDRLADYAIVKAANAKPSLPFQLRCEKDLQIGERLMSAGYGRTGYGLLTSGTVVDRGPSNRRFWLADVFVAIEVYLEPGMSGGPILDDLGRVVAINMGTNQLSLDRPRSVAVPITAACGTIQRYIDNGKLEGPNLAG